MGGWTAGQPNNFLFSSIGVKVLSWIVLAWNGNFCFQLLAINKLVEWITLENQRDDNF